MLNQPFEGGLSKPGFKAGLSLMAIWLIILFSTSTPKGREGRSALGKLIFIRDGGLLSRVEALSYTGVRSYVCSLGLAIKGGSIFKSKNAEFTGLELYFLMLFLTPAGSSIARVMGSKLG